MLKTYSHASLHAFTNCPRQFKFQYLEKPQVPSVVTADLYLGNAVHRVLAKLYKMAADGVLWPLADLLAAYAAEWEKPDRNEISVANDYLGVDDYIQLGRDMLTDYYAQHQPFNQGTLIGAERHLQAAVPGTSFSIKGFVDRLWKRPDGVVEICDYKTGGHLPAGPSDPLFRDQMDIYHFLVRSTWPQFADIELVQYFLKPREVIRYRTRIDDLDEVAERLRQGIIATINAERLDDFPTREGRLCTFCPYFALCPAKRHHLILQQEAGSSSEAERSTAETAASLADRYIEVDAQIKLLEAEKDALKADLVRAARELDLEKLEGSTGAVTVKGGVQEKFITKSKDEDKFAELSFLVRQYQLDDCLKIDPYALMDLYEKQRLPAEQIEALRAFIVSEDSPRVSIRRKKKSPSEDDEP